MTRTKQSAPPAGAERGELSQSCLQSTTKTVATQALDVFAEARQRYTVPELWLMLGLPGEPKASCRSPFRDERTPSFSIFDDGRGWKDHGTGEGGDVVSFVMAALGCDHAEARAWFLERLGLDVPTWGRLAPRHDPPPHKEIEWPAEPVTGTAETWAAFAHKIRMAYPAVHGAVECGLLRFAKVNGRACYVLTDNARRAAEIRRCDGTPFENDRKAYPLRGVDKAWPVGADLLREYPSREKPVLICEGATDLLAAWGAYCAYRRSGGPRSWLPVGLLGASCRRLHPELVPWLRGRTVRIAGDGDKAGRDMNEAWRDLLLGLGCTVEIVGIPDGRDLRDLLESGELKPGDLFA